MSETHEVTTEKDEFQPRVNEFTQKFVNDILVERDRLGKGFPIMTLLVDEAIDRVYTTGHIPGKELYADVFKQKPMKVTQKVFLPVKEFPFNFTGKILGPKGNTLRRLQQETQCRIAIKGRNSMRDKVKEEELRSSGDPKYAHFNKELYLEISALASPAESHARIAYALAEIRKYIIPDKNDEISQEQFREMNEINPEMTKNMSNYKHNDYKKINSLNSDHKYQKSGYRSHYEEPVYRQEQVDESYDYPRTSHRHQAEYEYNKVSSYKRTQPAMYASDVDRGRESPTAHYPYRHSGFKKY